MANVPLSAPVPSSTPGDAQGNVCLLPVDSISDLHSIPLDSEIPQEEEVTRDALYEKSMSTLPDKPEALRAAQPVSRSRCGSTCTNVILAFLIVIVLVNISLLLYILHLYRNQDTLLRTFTEKFYAKMDFLQQPSMNHEIQGHEKK